MASSHTIPPTAILSTSKLYLRPYEPADAQAMADACNDLNIAKYMSSRFPSPYTLADAHAWIAHCLSATADSGHHHYGIYTLSGEFVGSVDLEPLERDIYAGTRVLGYYCGRSFRGRGFMTEAVRELTRWAFATLPLLTRIEARIFENNPASQRVVAKAGFRKEGTMRCGVVKDGASMDEEIYGLIRADVEARVVLYEEEDDEDDDEEFKPDAWARFEDDDATVERKLTELFNAMNAAEADGRNY